MGRSPGATGPGRAPTRFVEIGPVTALHRARRLRSCRSRYAQHGLGARRPLGRRRGPARLAVGVRRRDPGPPPRPPPAATTGRRRSPRRGAFLADRPYVTRAEAAHRRAHTVSSVKVAVSAEFYPRGDDPVLGVWAHRQAMAARDAGADVRVLVLHRPVPPLRYAGRGPRRGGRRTRAAAPAAARRSSTASPSSTCRSSSAAAAAQLRTWGALGGARSLARADCAPVRRSTSSTRTTPCPPARPCAARGSKPLVVSVHGGDVFFTGPAPRRAEPSHGLFVRARLVLANSARHRAACAAPRGQRTRVVHLGADVPRASRRSADPTLVTIGHLVARKRHADVLAGDVDPARPAPAQIPRHRRRPRARGAGAPRRRARGRGRVRRPATARRRRSNGCAAAGSWRCRARTRRSASRTSRRWRRRARDRRQGGTRPGGDRARAARGSGWCRPATSSCSPPSWRRAFGARLPRGPRRARAATVAEQFTWESCGRATVAAYED